MLADILRQGNCLPVVLRIKLLSGLEATREVAKPI